MHQLKALLINPRHVSAMEPVKHANEVSKDMIIPGGTEWGFEILISGKFYSFWYATREEAEQERSSLLKVVP